MTPNPRPPGLSSADAQERLQRFGPNELSDRERKGFWRSVASVLAEPMFLLLVVAASLYLLIGDLGEGLLLAFFALVTIGLVILQQRRSEHALDALRALAAPQARVIRDGRIQRIAAHELVPGDALLLAEGERVAADAVVREATALAVDESLLTGESLPVRKCANGATVFDGTAAPGGDDSPQVYAGTLVVAGHGWAEVAATGRRSRMGQIGASLAAIDTAPTPLELNLHRLVRAFAVIAFTLSLLLVLWYGAWRGDWLQGALSGIALGMAMLPEEFPMALTVLLALGAWRLAKQQVLTRRPAVIEALGAATVLCIDKTGTLTENRMRVRRLVTPAVDVEVDGPALLPEAVHELLEYGLLASRRGGIDPMDRAIVTLGDASLADTEHLHPQWLLEQEYPLTPQLLAMSQSWTTGDAGRSVAAKGAPEAVAELCHLDAPATAALLAQVRPLAERGLRVIAVACGRSADGPPRAQQHDFDFTWLGLIAFEDPLRAGAAAAVAQAHRAGIAVVMITGDHVATALAIGAQAGIDTRAGALTGDDLARMDAAALAEAVRRVRVFARVMPEQKLRLVQALQADGGVVAMTGDGVNDAPALKAAHIGIAMGARGTDVAREAAAIVLLDEDIGRIVGGVRLGRRIFDNLRKVMTYITAIHVPIAGLALLPLLLGLPPLLLPAHVVLTEMVIDPMCSLAFDGVPEDPRLMERPPRPASSSLVGWPMLWRGFWQGAGVLVATLAVYAIALQAGVAEDEARALAVIGLTVGNLMLVAANASEGIGWRPLLDRGFAAFWWVAGVAALALSLAVLLPPLRALLHFGVPSAAAVAAVFAVELAAVALFHRLTGIKLPRARCAQDFIDRRHHRSAP